MTRHFLNLSLVAVFLGSATAELSPSDRIDELINANLKEHNLKPNASIDDSTFLRRAYLSIGGRIPTLEEAEAFQGSEYPNKRERLIEQLLNSEAYVSHFYNFWADILRMQDQGPSRNAFLHYQLWVKQALRDNMPYDEYVHTMVSSRGKTWENGATGYYHRDRGMPLDNMSNTVRIFLGTRLECAQCHNHPFDKWTQMDYYQMARFTYGVDARDIYTYAQNRINAGQMFKDRRKEAYLKGAGLGDGFPMPSLERLEDHIARHSKSPHDRWIGPEKGTMSINEFREAVKRGWAAAKEADELQHGSYWAGVHMYKPLLRYSVVEKVKVLELPHDYQYDDAAPLEEVSAKTMFGGEIDLENHEGSPVDAYADWMTSPENPTFTRVIANRLWKKAFGVGVIEPVDDFSDYIQPSNPELMAYLEELMVELDYDMRAYLNVLFNTKAWQRTANSEELMLGAPYHFAGPALQRMSAEQIWDSLVALCIPQAEHYRPLLKNQLASLERERLMWESLEGREFDEYVAMLKTLAPLVNRERSEGSRLSFAMAEAKKVGDEAEYERLKQELKDIQTTLKKAIDEVGYVELHKAKSGSELLGCMMGLSEMQMSSSMMQGTMMEGESKASVFTALPTIELPETPPGLSVNEQREWKKQQQGELRIFKQLVAKMARASELETPAPRGHFLRDFGQSDRDVIENASNHASVPQALNLLNGPMIEALTNQFAVFGRRLHAAESSEAKARIIFQAMMTRDPTQSEMELMRAEIARSGDDAFSGLVWVLLNTQRFLFVN